MPENKSAAAETPVNPIVFNGLKDVEWRIGVTTSSSEAQQVGQTFVQVKMVVENGSSNSIASSTSIGSSIGSSNSTGAAVIAPPATQTVQVEMSVPKFYAFLGEMEKVKASLGLFK